MRTMWWIWFPILLLFLFGPFRRRRYWRYQGWRESPPRPEGRSIEDSSKREEEQLRRDEQIESLETRVAELESRLDFAERLLAQRRENPALSETPPVR
ncbi:MAG: hypothetical protein HY700_14705 [Gemmatimonadetes bacterium]|nr:hypothetical protein [Gemmatimonadota bacterium]